MIDTKLNGLKELKELFDAGTISQEEFNYLKQDLLNTKSEGTTDKVEMQAEGLTREAISSKKAPSKNLVVVTAAILLAAFFMPLNSKGPSISAWEMVFGDFAEYAFPPARFIAVLIPASCAFIVLGAVNQGKYLIWRPILFSLPLITLILIGLMINEKTGAGSALKYDGAMNAFVEYILPIFGVGFWLTLLGSFFLIYLGLTSKSNTSANPSVQ